MFTKVKLYVVLAILALSTAVFGYYSISLSIQKRQLTEMIGEAQEEIAKSENLHKADLKKLQAKDIENKELRNSLTKMEKAGAKVISNQKIKTKEKKTKLTSEVDTPDKIKESCPEIGDTITIQCQHDFSVELSLAIVRGIRETYWAGTVKLFDGRKEVQSWKADEIDFSKSSIELDKSLFKKKKKWHGWQLGVGLAFSGDSVEPALYVGYGINF